MTRDGRVPKSERPRCAAVNRDGVTQCAALAIAGGSVCLKHGGSTASHQGAAAAALTVRQIDPAPFVAADPFEGFRNQVVQSQRVAAALLAKFEDVPLDEWTREEFVDGGMREVVKPLVELWLRSSAEARRAASEFARLDVDRMARAFELQRRHLLAAALERALDAGSTKAEVVQAFVKEIERA